MQRSGKILFRQRNQPAGAGGKADKHGTLGEQRRGQYMSEGQKGCAVNTRISGPVTPVRDAHFSVNEGLFQGERHGFGLQFYKMTCTL